jgi:hypothetical protein
MPDRPGYSGELDLPDAWSERFDPNFIRILSDYYFRRSPETGELVQTTGLIYPNNCTPKKLEPLIQWMDDLTQVIVAKTYYVNQTFSGDAADKDRIVQEAVRWSERLEFYRDELGKLVDAEGRGESIMFGGTTAADQRLRTLIVDPLFFGWYPNHNQSVSPFANQPPPYSAQTQQQQPDMATPISLIHQFDETNEAYAAATKDFLNHFSQPVSDILKDAIPDPPGGGSWIDFVVPLTIAAAFLYGFSMTDKGPGRGPKI